MKIRKYILSVFAGIAIALVSQELRGQGISIEQNYAGNSPAVVMVQTVFSATVYVNKLEMNERKFNLLVDSVKVLTEKTCLAATFDGRVAPICATWNEP